MKQLLILCLLLTTAVSIAQKDRFERIKALKVAHITEALELTTQEAEKFWPVYNKHDEKIHTLRKKERSEIVGKLRDGGLEKLSDEEANNLIDKQLFYSQEMVAHKTQMITELRKVISPKKIIRLHKAEDDFRKKLFERLKKPRVEKPE